jgi:hypothetical protein
MSFFIFSNNSDNIEGTLFKIAENQQDLNNLNIHQPDYKIIEISQVNFDAVKYGTKNVLKYNNNDIVFEDIITTFQDSVNKNNVVTKLAKEHLSDYILNCKNTISQFLKNNQNHQLFNRWNDYYNQLNSLNLNSIQYPLNMSLEQYFKNQNLPSLNPLQIP